MRMLELPPWNDQDSWNQIRQYFDHTFSTDLDFSSSCFLAAKIASKIAEIDESLNKLCGITCTSCLEVCCNKATVWYDFRDLLFLYLVKKEIPDKQITRKTNSTCIHLSQHGCQLKRLERPFICTWYICQKQSELLNIPDWGKLDLDLFGLLREIQTDRKMLEECFLASVTSSESPIIIGDHKPFSFGTI